ncbi:trimeric intracellular cation channel family protein [Vibrio stylophorae]|nr:trimeric intracellular cation channel family protein [Vibrio stylophorae]
MLITCLYLVGITAEAMTGALAAGRRQMDWFGVMLVASATAIGGGTVRDILLGHYPLGWVRHPEYLMITCTAGVLTTLIAPWVARNRRLFMWLDAIGLVVFSIIGSNVALDMGLPVSIAIVAAVVTGVFGGLLRDLICRQSPLVLHKELYASVSLLSSAVYIGLMKIGLDSVTLVLSTIVIGVTIRMAAVRYSWHLPVFHFADDSALVKAEKK